LLGRRRQHGSMRGRDTEHNLCHDTVSRDNGWKSRTVGQSAATRFDLDQQSAWCGAIRGSQMPRPRPVIDITGALAVKLPALTAIYLLFFAARPGLT